MNYVSDLSKSNEYLSFRSNVPLKKIVVDNNNSKEWKIYDCGPKEVNTPLICLPPVSGTADIYFKQALGLSAKGYRVISIEPPNYWTVREFCEGFKKLLDHLNLRRVHIFGNSLGGFLAQKFAEYSFLTHYVVSLILCNSFTDTSIFYYSDTANFFWILPSMVLKRMLIGNFNTVNKLDSEMIEAIDFMVERLETLSQCELASRLTLNCLPNVVDTSRLSETPITILNVLDGCALSNAVTDDLVKCYPHAKLAHLKSGGNFPYLSRAPDVNLHIEVHLRQFENTEFKASIVQKHSNFSQ